MLRVIPPDQINQITLVLNNRSEVAVDMFFRFESNFLVLRGRVAGTTDEGRAFFIPYDQMVYFRIERVVNLIELQAIFDGKTDRTAVPFAENAVAVPEVVAPAAANGIPPTDATAARNALLDRIRATRATQPPMANPRHESQ